MCLHRQCPPEGGRYTNRINPSIFRDTAIDATFYSALDSHVEKFMPEQFVFRDLRDLLAKANEEKSGDQLGGLAARSERERVAAKRKLADLTLGEIVRQPLIDPSQDEVSRLLLESYDAERFQRIQGMTVGEFREFILDDATNEHELKQLQWAI